METDLEEDDDLDFAGAELALGAPRTMYSGDGEGRWWKRTWQPQCGIDVILWGRCQGTVGHAGDHWNYSKCGSYNWSREGAGGGSTPPSHEKWISPVAKAAEFYLCFCDDDEVADPVIIAQLNSGLIPVGSTVTQPCSDEDIAELKQMGRLPEDLDLSTMTMADIAKLPQSPEDKAFNDRMAARYGENDASKHECWQCGKQATEWSPEGWGCRDCLENY